MDEVRPRSTQVETRLFRKCGAEKKTAGLPLQPHVGGTYGFSSPALLGDKALMFSGGDSSASLRFSKHHASKKMPVFIG